MWENIAGAKRYSRPRGFNIAGAIERPRRPRRSDASAVADRKVRASGRAKWGSGACSGRVYVPSNCFRAAVNVIVGPCCPALVNCIDADVHTVVSLGK